MIATSFCVLESTEFVSIMNYCCCAWDLELSWQQTSGVRKLWTVYNSHTPCYDSDSKPCRPLLSSLKVLSVTIILLVIVRVCPLESIMIFNPLHWGVHLRKVWRLWQNCHTRILHLTAWLPSLFNVVSYISLSISSLICSVMWLGKYSKILAS